MEDTDETMDYMTNEEYRRKSQDYAKLIVKIIENTNDTWILEQIYRYAKNMTKEG